MLPKIDLHDSKAVEARIAEYFSIYAKYDTKPTVKGLANALGVDRRRLWEISTGNYNHPGSKYASIPAESGDSIKRAYGLLEELWENYMANGKINPVTGIFLAKNNYDYQDKVEHVITPNVKQESDFSAEDIQKRYLTEGTDSDS